MGHQLCMPARQHLQVMRCICCLCACGRWQNRPLHMYMQTVSPTHESICTVLLTPFPLILIDILRMWTYSDIQSRALLHSLHSFILQRTHVHDTPACPRDASPSNPAPHSSHVSNAALNF